MDFCQLGGGGGGGDGATRVDFGIHVGQGTRVTATPHIKGYTHTLSDIPGYSGADDNVVANQCTVLDSSRTRICCYLLVIHETWSAVI